MGENNLFRKWQGSSFEYDLIIAQTSYLKSRIKFESLEESSITINSCEMMPLAAYNETNRTVG